MRLTFHRSDDISVRFVPCGKCYEKLSWCDLVRSWLLQAINYYIIQYPVCKHVEWWERRGEERLLDYLNQGWMCILHKLQDCPPNDRVSCFSKSPKTTTTKCWMLTWETAVCFLFPADSQSWSPRSLAMILWELSIYTAKVLIIWQ